MCATKKVRRLFEQAQKLKAGEYLLPEGQTAEVLQAKLSKIKEGYTIDQMLNRQKQVSGTQLEQIAKSLMDRLVREHIEAELERADQALDSN